MICHSPRRSNLCTSTLVSHAAAESAWLSAATALSGESVLSKSVPGLFSSPISCQAGSANDSPLVRTAQAMRAFFAATATTAFQ